MSNVALYTGLSGLIAHARRLDVIGNNIANANTTAYKSSRALFSDQFSWTLSQGDQPRATTGGSNPKQVGLGVQVAATQRNFATGSTTITGDPRDLAIEGRGFFMIGRSGETLYTRDGSFRQDAESRLVTADGEPLLGWGVDSDFQVQRGGLVPLAAPVGRLSFARATENVRLSGNLNAGGVVATRGAGLRLGATDQTGFQLIPNATRPAPAPNRLDASSLLTEIADPSATTAPLFSAGQVFQVSGAERGQVSPTATVGKSPLRPATYTITPTSTVSELMSFLTDALGIGRSTGTNPDGSTPGVSLDALNGRLNVTGNTGTINDLFLDSTDVRLLAADGTFVRNPLNSTKTGSATGESVRTSLLVRDSLGAAVALDVGAVLVERGTGGTRWRYEVDSSDNPGAQIGVASGVMRFDATGQLQEPPTTTISLDRSGSGAASPQSVTLRLGDASGFVSALARPSRLAGQDLDGAAPGTLSSFGFDEDGFLVGSFTNGLTRTLGQVALATFPNQEGLVADSGNLFRLGANSGAASVVQPGLGGSGRILGGTLEQSNVDLSREFIELIQTSTGYSASSRVIKAADELLQQLMVLGR